VRSPLWFVMAGVIAVLGFVAAGLYVWPRLEAFDLHLTRLALPGPHIVQLDRAGAYTLYLETNGQFPLAEAPAGLQATLTSVATGTTVALVPPAGSFTYSAEGRAGLAILGFTLSEPGQYRLTASLPSKATESKFTLAVGHGSVAHNFFGMARILGVALALALGGLGIAGIIVAIIAIRRDKARRAEPLT